MSAFSIVLVITMMLINLFIHPFSHFSAVHLIQMLTTMSCWSVLSSPWQHS